MARKRKNEQGLGFMGPTRDIVIGGTILGVGATIVGRVGGPTGGISAAASFLPVIGVTVGGGLALRQLRRLQSQEGRKRRR